MLFNPQWLQLPAQPRLSPVAAGWSTRRWSACLLLLAILAVAIRARYFGNPTIDVDEEFYLLAGDRLLHGAIPYVDLWDRKPIGLFLLYAGIRLLGGDGVIQYQLVAAAFVAATAVSIAGMARRIATPAAALTAGLSYVPALAMSGGQGGQAPVFYNLPMVWAAWLVLDLVAARSGPSLRSHAGLTAGEPSAWERTRPALPRADRRRRWRGAAAMLLVGLAIQIKDTAVFEGGFLGLALLWPAWRRRVGLVALLPDTALWVGCAALPTSLAWGWYGLAGHGDAFVYANFISIFRRGEILHLATNLRHIAVRLSPFMVTLAVGHAVLADRLPAAGDARMRSANRLVLGWLASAVAGFGLMGGYLNHYALPLLPPLTVACAAVFSVRFRRAGGLLAFLVLAPLLVAYPLDARKYERRNGDAAYGYRLARFIAPRLHDGCLYVFYGEPILYHLTGSCLPTRWAFPFHLAVQREAGAIGVDPLSEARRIMATHPPVVVDRISDADDVNIAVRSLVRAMVRRDYRLVLAEPHHGRRWAVDLVYQYKGAR